MKTITTLTLTALAISGALQAKEQSANKPVEVIEVQGQRNAPLTEVSVQTQKLLNVAGIDNDPLSAVFSLPGVVHSGGDHGGEPAIRGSSPEDNAFFIDNMPVDYIFHIFGDSIFNKNVVQDFSLHSAAFGSEYGNATGGVFDVKLRAPRNQDITTTVDASLLKTGIMVEGGLAEDHAFYISYRRSLIHLFLPEGEEEDGLTIFEAPQSDDYQAKYQWLIGNDHRLTFTALGANDIAGINISEASEEGRLDPDNVGDLEITTGFDSQSLVWDYFGDHSQVLNVVLAHSSESVVQNYGEGQYIRNDEEELNFRVAYQVDIGNDHILSTGGSVERVEADYSYDVIPYFCTDHDADCSAKKGERRQDKDVLTMVNSAFYIKDNWAVSANVELEIGARAEYNDYTEQSFVHPRLAAFWYVSDDLKITTKAGRYSRFPDIDTVLRKLGNPELDAPTATHYSLGADYQINDIWQTSIEVYHKDLEDMALSLDPETDIEQRRYSNDLSGTASGVEWVVKRERENGWYGWASVSWSQSERTDELTNITKDYHLDTPLLGNVVANYQLNERWDFGLRYTIRSGARYTPIIGLRENPDHPNRFLANYGELNAKTLPAYQRLDLQANYKTTIFSHPVEWQFALINALNSDNVSGYYYAAEEGDSLTNFKIEGEADIGMFPSIGLSTQF
ncbi:TonB-dependent receptor [Psychrobium sp. 1_MG-2023]|uniref:TonB-dependent receptor n=1 Tax=Psychrobium sp. 1_MG-2023 TaxID=3062624 RepID=UPI000C33B1EA|nr:TonB-dependent receptor [Psychrobium sp. 1_MG-2023]MDP2562558.1 TonB-dependent receptor [Psychrobium sp. 1_MG-2023]PKF54422.1 TonB-dependent receptor [Alteromonadales bacterium alter-6D02]